MITRTGKMFFAHLYLIWILGVVTAGATKKGTQILLFAKIDGGMGRESTVAIARLIVGLIRLGNMGKFAVFQVGDVNELNRGEYCSILFDKILVFV